MGTAPDQQARIIGIEEVGLVDNVEPAAFLVAIRDGGDRSNPAPHSDRRKEFPVLLGVQISDQVLQVPIGGEPVALGVKKQRIVVERGSDLVVVVVGQSVWWKNSDCVPSESSR